MDEDFINYGALIDDAMHIIVKKALSRVAAKGLPGDHHFFISFITHFPGVQLSQKLRQKYPEEMTIVLQYQFEELTVGAREFSVVLSFDNLKEKVIIPFSALTAFADPSVRFGLQFRHVEEQEASGQGSMAEIKEFVNPEPADSQNQPASGKKRGAKASVPDVNTTNVITLDKFRKKQPEDK